MAVSVLLPHKPGDFSEFRVAGSLDMPLLPYREGFSSRVIQFAIYERRRLEIFPAGSLHSDVLDEWIEIAPPEYPKFTAVQMHRLWFSDGTERLGFDGPASWLLGLRQFRRSADYLDRLGPRESCPVCCGTLLCFWLALRGQVVGFNAQCARRGCEFAVHLSDCIASLPLRLPVIHLADLQELKEQLELGLRRSGSRGSDRS